MPTASAPPRHWSNLPADLGDPVQTLDLVLASEGIAPGTRRIYCESLTWLAQRSDFAGWESVTRDHVRRHLAWLIAQGYSTSYVSNQLRGMKAGFKRLAKEESIPDILHDITGPVPVPKLVPVLADGQFTRLIAACGRNTEGLRDAAIIHVLASSGCRLAELAAMKVNDIDVNKRVAYVVGKAGKPRFIRFDAAAALAISRYLRVRRSDSPMLWLGAKGDLSKSGIFQAFKRRARMAGMPGMYPHQMRHDFSHRFLAAGGEGADLMMLNGWASASMLNRYGKSAASQRAMAAYDRVMG